MDAQPYNLDKYGGINSAKSNRSARNTPTNNLSRESIDALCTDWRPYSLEDHTVPVYNRFRKSHPPNKQVYRQMKPYDLSG